MHRKEVLWDSSLGWKMVVLTVERMEMMTAEQKEQHLVDWKGLRMVDWKAAKLEIRMVDLTAVQLVW